MPCQRLHDLGHLLGDGGGLEAERHLGLGETGGDEEVLDHATQLGRLAVDERDQVLRRLVVLLLEQHLGEPVDGGERCPQLMGDVGDELVARPGDLALGGESGVELDLGRAELPAEDRSVDEDEATGQDQGDEKRRDHAGEAGDRPGEAEVVDDRVP